MPICENCDKPFSAETFDDTPGIERLYRAVADGEPKLEIMHMIFSMFGDSSGLRPPASELRLAAMTTSGARKHG